MADAKLLCPVAYSKAAALVGSLLLTGSVQAATFSVLCDGTLETVRQACTIKLTGRIVDGDADRLRSVLRRAPPTGSHYHALLLDSPGGSVPAAIELAKVVRQAVLDTTNIRIPKDTGAGIPKGQIKWRCISACFLVWVAGAEREALIYPADFGSTSDIGLHRPYLDKAAYINTPEAVALAQQQIMRATSQYLQQEQVPQTLIDKMLQRASTQVYWLSGDEDQSVVGKAAWFEEMMIARCGYDPTYDVESSAWASQTVLDSVKSQLANGVKNPVRPDLGPRYAKYLEWKQQYNACEYAARQAAQASLRR